MVTCLFGFTVVAPLVKLCSLLPLDSSLTGEKGSLDWSPTTKNSWHLVWFLRMVPLNAKANEFIVFCRLVWSFTSGVEHLHTSWWANPCLAPLDAAS